VLERIIQEHLIGGRVVEEYAFAKNPLLDHRWTQMDTDQPAPPED
jgi:hypothetical protein